MNSFQFILFISSMLTVLSQITVDQNELKLMLKFFETKEQILSQDFLEILQEAFIKAYKNYDNEMLEEIAEDLIHYLNIIQFNQAIVSNYLEKETFTIFANQWIKNMQQELIRQYANGTYIDEDFSEEMMRNPDFYGLNYISYKIISFSKPDIKKDFQYDLEDV